ncbi:sensor histidine kinase [Pseudogemmobacter faecipullorum]|uniref:histidine kinase n=1 Tax=Pseudogemmobacter faecipullorum TaxID=2755041 RepID=A0ABS8CNJ0_9RHOB|nr:histidine kinase dimerization/phospho-acceptor domain-containing protein [Pseudogemmobacter faecipullorum]MCB5410760.1 hypothetical protein [Pseudogemmobacter faecipullorum]
MSAPANRPWSIRRRLTRRVLLLVGVIWLVTAALAVAFLDYEIGEMLDEEMEVVAQTTVLFLDATPGGVVPRNIGINSNNGERILRILRSSDPVPDQPWPVLTEDGFHRVPGWRVLRLSAEHAVIEVGHSTTWRREEMLEAGTAFLLLILPMILLLILGLRYSLSQGFAPLEALTRAISGRAPGDLSPLPEHGLPRELAPLAQGLNQYTTRIGELRHAERQFVANASHELRTPVAAIRARLDLSQDPEARATLPLLDSLTRRVERLLQLSRSEAGIGLGRGPGDLVQILRLLLREVGEHAAHPILFDDGDFDEMPVAADPDALAILLRNLLENAVGHGSGLVRLRLSREGEGAARLVISNPAAEGFRDQPFARRPGSQGVGLGLSIVEQLARAMEVGVTKSFADGKAEITLIFARLPQA